MKRRGIQMKLVIEGPAQPPASPDPNLVKMIARAHLWNKQLISGEMPSARDIARHWGTTESYVRRLLPHAFLSPDIVDMILAGRQSVGLIAARRGSTERTVSPGAGSTSLRFCIKS